jgi:hypothetical protein
MNAFDSRKTMNAGLENREGKKKGEGIFIETYRTAKLTCKHFLFMASYRNYKTFDSGRDAFTVELFTSLSSVTTI